MNMKVKEIPLSVFKKLSREFGKGKEEVIKYGSQKYRTKELKPRGCIGFCQGNDYFTFVLWPYRPKGNVDPFKPAALVKIYAGAIATGEWAYGRGRHLKEDVSAEIKLEGLPLNHILMPVVINVLSTVHEFATLSGLFREDYWEVERFPKRDYTRP